MTITPGRGLTFLVPSGPGEDQKHLHILLTDICPAGYLLAVPIQTVYAGEYYDSTCLLREGDHPFITHLSWVAYHKSVLLSSSRLIEQFTNFSYIIKDAATAELLGRVGSGLMVSKRATKKIRTYFSTNGPSER
jgi:hypothetical protein